MYIMPLLGTAILWRCGSVLSSGTSIYCKNGLHSLWSMLILTALQAFAALTRIRAGDDPIEMVTVFAAVAVMGWLLFLCQLWMGKTAMDGPILGLLLCTLGLATQKELGIQTVAVGLGIGTYVAVERLRGNVRAGIWAGALALALLALTAVAGKRIHGARNWLILGPVSIQPSELSKLSFAMLVGVQKNTKVLCAYCFGICLLLGLMNDVGAAAVFFAGFLAAACFCPQCRGITGLTVTALATAGAVAVRLAPHALGRFSAWRHIWEQPAGSGYQQTKGLMCLASGGLFGLGAGQGWMRNLFAGDSDMVFAAVGEQWGLMTALLTVGAVLVLGLSVLKQGSVAAHAAAGMLLAQSALNVLGAVDVLPMTGVTLPFVSSGGTAMVAAWGLLAVLQQNREAL